MTDQTASFDVLNALDLEREGLKAEQVNLSQVYFLNLLQIMKELETPQKAFLKMKFLASLVYPYAFFNKDFQAILKDISNFEKKVALQSVTGVDSSLLLQETSNFIVSCLARINKIAAQYGLLPQISMSIEV